MRHCDDIDAIARALATALLRGPIERDAMVTRATKLFGRRWRWVGPLVDRIHAAVGNRARPRHRRLTLFIVNDAGFLRACERHLLKLSDFLPTPNDMAPVAAARDWGVPPLRTTGELATWLGLSMTELLWFADRRELVRQSINPRLGHYHYRLLAKRFGQVRLIEAPKPRLKAIQRQILDELLAHVPVHAAAHGFCRGHSVQSFVAPHVARQAVLRIDLRDFFPSISQARVAAMFRSVGYPEAVADLLAALTTTSTPDATWDDDAIWRLDPREQIRLQGLYARRHVPQGSPTSPALANLAAYRLDSRLTALAKAAGATYTRYADDLAFSGDADFARHANRFQLHAAAVALDEGFRVHHRKTRLMRPGVRQHLAGIVVNTHANVPRDEFDRLKATLTNCVRLGPASQNRTGCEDFRAHLVGRISYVAHINPVRGQKLRTLLERITW